MSQIDFQEELITFHQIIQGVSLTVFPLKTLIELEAKGEDIGKRTHSPLTWFEQKVICDFKPNQNQHPFFMNIQSGWLHAEICVQFMPLPPFKWQFCSRPFDICTKFPIQQPDYVVLHSL